MSETIVGMFTASFRTSEAITPVFVTSCGIVETIAFPLFASSFWNRKVSNLLHSNNRTHIKDLKNLIKVQLPCGNRLLVALGAKASRDRIPFTPLDQPPLNLCYGPAIESI